MTDPEKDAFAAGFKAGEWAARTLFEMKIRGWAERAHALAVHFSMLLASTAIGDLEALADEMQATIIKKEDSDANVAGGHLQLPSSEAS